MSKSLEKRRSLLANVKRRHDDWGVKLDKLSSVPEGVLKDWDTIDKQFGQEFSA